MTKRSHDRADLVEETCTKIPYNTPQEAFRVVSRSKGRKTRKEIDVYYCEICRAHHVTSSRR